MSRHMRVLCALGMPIVLAALCLSDHSAEARRFKSRQQSELGSGTNARAYLVAHNLSRYQHLSVLKVIRRQSPRQRAQRTMDKKARKKYADRIVKLHSRLRKSSRFNKRFGDIVPETISPEAGVLLQEQGHGIAYAKLSKKAKKRAGREKKAAKELAQKLFPKYAFSKYSKNFLFDKKGYITSWYDILSDKSAVNFR